MVKQSKKDKFAVILVTAPNVNSARNIAKKALEEKLIACANIVPKIESHYWWEGKIEKSNEVLLIMKTTVTNVKSLEKTVLLSHPYKTPEFIVLKFSDGFQGYLNWITESVTGK